MALTCPACLKGTMCVHDVGYDECDFCTFFAIYDDGRNPPVWTEEELQEAYAKCLEEGPHSFLRVR